MSPDQEHRLSQDWNEITDRIAFGEVESISADVGEALQLRPKAADSRVVCDAIGIEGQRIQTAPRGFTFGRGLLEAYYQAMAFFVKRSRGPRSTLEPFKVYASVCWGVLC